MARLARLVALFKFDRPGFRCMLTKLHSIADRQWMAVTLTGLFAFAGSVAVGLIAGIAEPNVHDEFSYLLAADTFAHGRVTNPTHPMWVHFESFHIIHQPTYMSKYPPGHGLILAAGQILTGHPIAGAWMSMGLMCAAICWMLYAWVPPRWAFFGGILALINPMLGVTGSWAQSYWSGAVAATGGALILGGIRRVMRRPRASSALVMGVGLAILANTRPYEGLIFSLPLAIILLQWMRSAAAPAFWVSIRRIVMPIAVIVVLTGAAMGFYNFRVTGDIFRLPYQVHAETYGMAPLFLLQKETPEPNYRHQVLRDFHQLYELDFYKRQRSMPLLIIPRSAFVILLATVYCMNILAIPLIGSSTLLARWTLRNEWALRAFLIYLVSIGGLALTTYVSILYLAPVIALNYYFVLSAMRLWQFRNRRVGRFMSRILPLLAIVALLASLLGKLIHDDPSAWYRQRAGWARQLARQEGKHLILVSYGPRHSFHEEWVYNEANIDEAKIIWARQMNAVQDCKLIGYFRDRRIWSLEVDGAQASPILKPYAHNRCRDLNYSATSTRVDSSSAPQ